MKNVGKYHIAKLLTIEQYLPFNKKYFIIFKKVKSFVKKKYEMIAETEKK